MSNYSGKDKSELIDEKLMGLEINDGDKNYGIICRIDQVNNSFKVYTNLGYTFNAGLILNLVALSNLYDKAANNDDENVEHLPPAFIHNAKLSNKIMSRPKPMPHTKKLRSNGKINNDAVVSKSETVNITSHISNSESFPEEYHYQNKKSKNLLTIDDICERNGITVNEYLESRKDKSND